MIFFVVVGSGGGFQASLEMYLLCMPKFSLPYSAVISLGLVGGE